MIFNISMKISDYAITEEEDNYIFKNLVLDNKGDFVSEKTSKIIYNVSPNGKYIFNLSPNEFEPSKDIEIYDTSFKKIKINGFKQDKSFINFTFLTDTLIYVERAYLDNVNSDEQTNEILKTEFYNFSNNNLKKIKDHTFINPLMDMIFFRLRLFNNDVQLIDDQIYDFQNRIVYDLSGNILNQYKDLRLSVSENDGIIIEESDFKLIKENKSKIFIPRNGAMLYYLNSNFSIHNSYIISSIKKDFFKIRDSSFYNLLTKTSNSFKGRVIVDKNRFMILTNNNISFGEIK